MFYFAYSNQCFFKMHVTDSVFGRHWRLYILVTLKIKKDFESQKMKLMEVEIMKNNISHSFLKCFTFSLKATQA